MRILIIGTGYVGLVTGACFAEKGHHVTCLDINEQKIALLNKGHIPIHEPLLEDLVKKNIADGSLVFTTDYSFGVSDSEVAFISTPTPSNEDGSADLIQIYSAAKSLASHLTKQPMLVVIKSTVPPGTAQSVESMMNKTLQALGKECVFNLISNPEFLREGSAVNDCLNPDRVIIGLENIQIKEKIEELYSPFNLQKQQLIFMDRCSAEMTKYAANAMLATRISFMNELSGLCDKLGANIENIRIGIGSDPRIGPQFLFAGIGFGGSCFPKDIRALKAKAQELGHETPILNAIETVNELQKKILAEKIKAHFSKNGGIEGKTIAVWGLSFKPNTDDIREAPSLSLIKELRDLGAKLKLFDPVAMDNAKAFFQNDENVSWCSNEYEASEGAEAIALVTEWKQFQQADLEKTLLLMSGNAFFDGRNQYEAEKMTKTGFEYFGIGIPKVF